MDNFKNIINLLEIGDFSYNVLLSALQMTGKAQIDLFSLARKKRKQSFSDNICQARSVIEISNVCKQKCNYCAIGSKDQALNYTLKAKQIEVLINYLYDKGRRVILLQSGENVSNTFLNDVIDAVSISMSNHSDLKIILCLGNLPRHYYQALYDAGATDYILKFESSNAKLFSYCKPNDTLSNRMQCISNLCEIGYNVGSGNIVGLPTQTLDDIVGDLHLIHKLPLSMNSSTIFIPAENSTFANKKAGNPIYTLNMMALMRIMNPQRYMPTTSSLEKIIPDGQFLGLMAGANTVTIHDGTPEELQKYFPIYSSKRIRPQINHFRDILNRAGMKADNIT